MVTLTHSSLRPSGLGGCPPGPPALLTGFHLTIARIVGQALSPHGFALGGGYGLQAHGITDRLSKDLDTYTESQEASVYQNGEESLLAALTEAGFRCTVERRDSWFRQIIVTNPPNGEQVGVDLGYDYRLHPPVRIKGIGPVLSLDDVIAGKTRALVDRQAERDYADIDRGVLLGKFALSVNRTAGQSNTKRREVAPSIRPRSAGTCRFCGRPLRSATSIARGYGPDCAKRAR